MKSGPISLAISSLDTISLLSAGDVLIATVSTCDLIAVSSIGSDVISINFLTFGLIAVISSFLPVDLEATPISSANENRFGLIKLSIQSGRFCGGVGISDGSETIAKLLNAV